MKNYLPLILLPIFDGQGFVVVSNFVELLLEVLIFCPFGLAKG